MIDISSELPGIQSFHDDSKVWVFQADRMLKENEVSSIQNEMNAFVSTWTAHNLELNAKTWVWKNYCLVVVVDAEGNDASGCSIDKLIHQVQKIGMDFNIDFFNRLNLLILVGNEIVLTNKKSLVNEIDSGHLTSDVLIADNTISNKLDIVNKWLLPINMSWLAKFLTPEKST